MRSKPAWNKHCLTSLSAYNGENSSLACDVAQVAGGPKVPMRYGRKDARDHKDCAVEGNLPGD